MDGIKNKATLDARQSGHAKFGANSSVFTWKLTAVRQSDSKPFSEE